MIKLTKKDWEECKQAAEAQLKRVAIEDQIYQMQLEVSIKALKELEHANS